MKAIEIAKNNIIKIDEILEACKQLNIPCSGSDADLSDNDAYRVKNYIEDKKKSEKKEKENLLQDKKVQPVKKKKIKLKRKIHKRTAEEEKVVAAEKKPVDEKPAEQKKPQTTAKPASGKKEFVRQDKRTGGPDKRTGGPDKSRDKKPPFNRDKKPQFNKDKKPGVGQEQPAAFADDKSKSSRNKRKEKDKDKEKESRKNRKTEFADSKSKYNKVFHNKKKKGHEPKVVREAVPPSHIEITESISVGDLSKKLNVKANEVIAKLMNLGIMATINQILDSETAEILASEYGTEVKVVSLYDETVIKDEQQDLDQDNLTRCPIITVMGHVDHGKTKLLDAIRSAEVTESEFGGITQHIGAYQVTIKGNKMTFLDTPGHEAFTTMRARGASVTDIVILVVAANDGVMPQTIEAINHAKDAKVPIIVAINKIDLQDANPQKVKQELAAYDLAPEEWGGTTLYSEISAKNNINIDGLLELISMQAELLELKANDKLRGTGTVIEAKLDPGRGSVATILVQNGTLNVGDPFVVGVHSGKVRAMFNDQGKTVKVAGPSTPVEVLGLDGIPSAGDPFQVVTSDRYAKQIGHKRQDLKRIESAKKVKKVTLENLNDMIQDGEVQDVHIIIKADVDGSVQALKDSLEKLSTNEVRVKVIHAGAGGINESDVMLAAASNALIIGYHVRPSAHIVETADRENVDIKTYNIIFEVTEDVKKAMEGMLAPDIKEEIVGTGEIKQTFKVSKIGTIAGSVVLTGKLQRSNKMRIIRDGVVVYDGALSSLKRFKDDANEVIAGQDCGFNLEKFNDIKVGDTFEAYKLVEIAKKLNDK